MLNITPAQRKTIVKSLQFKFGDNPNVEDYVQEAIMNANEDEKGKIRDPVAYVKWYARRLLLNDKRFQRDPERMLPLETAEELPVTYQYETTLDVKAAFARLPQDYQQVIWDYYYEGYTQEEMAARYGSSRVGAWKKIQKALELLRHYLAEGRELAQEGRRRAKRGRDRGSVGSGADR